jgi:hypothetical protein
MSQIEYNSKSKKKLQREMSKAGQQVKKMQSEDVNASFSDNSETEREKTSNRKPTGSNERNPKTYKRRKKYLLGVR